MDNFDVQAVNRDTVVGNGRRRGVLVSTPPICPSSGALPREHLVAVPPLTLDQEHMVHIILSFELPSAARRYARALCDHSCLGLIYTLCMFKRRILHDHSLICALLLSENSGLCTMQMAHVLV